MWGSEVNEIRGFDINALSPPRKLNNKRSGRSSGGILVLAKRQQITSNIILKYPSFDLIF